MYISLILLIARGEIHVSPSVNANKSRENYDLNGYTELDNVYFYTQPANINHRNTRVDKLTFLARLVRTNCIDSEVIKGKIFTVYLHICLTAPFRRTVIAYAHFHWKLYVHIAR